MASPNDFLPLGISPQAAGAISRAINAGISGNPAITALTALTDSSGGTAGNTIAAVPATYTQATLANQLASQTAKINAIIAALKTVS